MLVTASCWRECSRCFCFAAPSNFAFTWATALTIRINSCPVKCSRNVAGSGHFVDGRLTGRYPAGFHGGISPLKSASRQRLIGHCWRVTRDPSPASAMPPQTSSLGLLGSWGVFALAFKKSGKRLRSAGMNCRSSYERCEGENEKVSGGSGPIRGIPMRYLLPRNAEAKRKSIKECWLPRRNAPRRRCP